MLSLIYLILKMWKKLMKSDILTWMITLSKIHVESDIGTMYLFFKYLLKLEHR